jgi:uncharacterized protein YodC (DUF2158 family)
MLENEKVYFHAGDVVELKQEVSNKPRMVVEKVEKLTFKDTMSNSTSTTKLMGVQCFWFDSIGALQRSRFNTKDLRLLSKNADN